MTTLASPEATAALAAELAAHIQPGDVVTLSGGVGAGKTSFVRGLLAGLGFSDDVPSPTFPIVIPYDAPAVRVPLWHVDLYRLDSAHEVAALALDDALYDHALVIEWPERLAGGRWPGALALRFDVTGATTRRLTADVPPSWKARWFLQ